MTATRGTTNGNARGSYITRARRRAWLLETYAANQTLVLIWEQPADFTAGKPHTWQSGSYSPDGTIRLQKSWGRVAIAVPTARCFRCGRLLYDDPHQGPHHVTVDRIIPGCHGGTYRRDNIRPACGDCNSETGGRTRSKAPRKANPAGVAPTPTEPPERPRGGT